MLVRPWPFGGGGGVEADAVIGDFEGQLPVCLGEADADLGGVGVLDGVLDGFEHAESN